MLRKNLFLVSSLALALLAGSATTGLASGSQAAARLTAPHVPANGPFSANTKPNLKADLASLAKQTASFANKTPAPTSKNLPDAVRAAVALQKSLTAVQKLQLRTLEGRYLAQAKQILDASAKPSAPTKGRAPGNVRDQAATLAKLSADLESGVAKVLSPKQYLNHLAATRVVASSSLSAVAPHGNAAAASVRSTPQQTSTCYYGGYYDSLATWYKYWGYYYSYYNYVTYGGTNAYYGYYYAYYAYSYGPTASEQLSAAYFEYLTVGSDWLGFGSAGATNAYYEYYDAYYGYIYDYYSYSANTSHSYAYYAYYYEYYAQYYGYYGYYYGTNYCK